MDLFATTKRTCCLSLRIIATTIGVISSVSLASCAEQSSGAVHIIRAATRPPIVSRSTHKLALGETAPDISIELATAPQPLNDSRHDREFVNGTVFLAKASQLDRTTIIEIVNGEGAATIAATKAVQFAVASVTRAEMFSHTSHVDAYAENVAATQAWYTHSHPRKAITDINAAAGPNDIAWGFEADDGYSAHPHALRDIYAHGTYPTVVILDKNMRAIFVARRLAAENYETITHAVGAAVIAEDKADSK